MTFASLQREFAAAMLDPARALPLPVTSHTARRPEKRFAVYRNNVVVSLIEALRARFPATERIVGEECFKAVAHAFVTANPPRSPLLMRYGDAFPAFLGRLEPLAALPYLPDVARLEVARTNAYHAADAAPLDPVRLQALSPDELVQTRVVLHPSAHILRSRHPVVTIWAMNSGEIPIDSIDESAAEDALVVRPQYAVAVRKLPPGGALFLLALQAGLPLGAAAARATASASEFDLGANLAGMFTAGAMAGLIASEPTKD